MYIINNHINRKEKLKMEKKTILTKNISSNIVIKIIYFLTSILLAIPSIMYLIKNKTIYNNRL